MADIFISYRRDDAAGFAGRLADALEREFGAAAVFRDHDDIHGGDDFAAVIEQALGEFVVMLVVIGPSWLGAMRDGVRRLEENDDFVRLEVRRGLESGKPVLPILVAGASMPGEKDLPPALAALARRQAVVLGDASWPLDVARLVTALRSLLGTRRPSLRRRISVALGVLVATLIGASIGLDYFAPDRSGGPVAKAPVLVSGSWAARIVYDWGAAHDERFDLHFAGNEVRGTASYLGLARPLVSGERDGERIGFVTHSEEVLGDAPARAVTHRYHGRIDGETLRLTLETSGGHTPHAPVDFVATRLP